ncbi:MAG: aminotransferase class I/II-fold pyridoxal phosphate-dependent enzyme [Deltaproteobacteria bacterium]|nr:aminotransferase class I/II-fold pyridoxal phosphate-dependent enzyme [Deltaproteobacteria bacterium]
MNTDLKIAPPLDEENVSIYDVFRQQRSKDSHPINLTVGNPNLPPPPEYYEAMNQVLNDIRSQEWNGHGYMVESDPFGLCQKIAEGLTRQFDLKFDSADIMITVGATGALDIISKTLLDPTGPCATNPEDNEVLIMAPYFVEYINIVEANGGVPLVVHTNERFSLDLDEIEKTIRPRTKMIWINSPNNPTGTIYTASELVRLAEIVAQKEKQFGTRIYIIEDAVYDTIHFQHEAVPSLVNIHPRLFRVNSWSKSLSLSGERIGYFALHPNLGDKAEQTQLRDALFLSMRMRVVHAPLLQHRILAKLPFGLTTNMTYYQRNIDTLYQCIKSLGFTVVAPQGTFYLWCVLPSQFRDESEFRPLAMAGNDPLLYLPGFLFGGNNYRRCVRFSACVAHDEIERACKKLAQIITKSQQIFKTNLI